MFISIAVNICIISVCGLLQKLIGLYIPIFIVSNYIHNYIDKLLYT